MNSCTSPNMEKKVFWHLTEFNIRLLSSIFQGRLFSFSFILFESIFCQLNCMYVDSRMFIFFDASIERFCFMPKVATVALIWIAP